jgi:hypothetical protein
MSAAPEQIALFDYELKELGHNLRLLQGPVNADKYKHPTKDESLAAGLRRAAAPLIGSVMVGHLRSMNHYFRFRPHRPEGEPAFVQVNFDNSKFHLKEYRGVFTGIRNIPLRDRKIICAQFAPLARQEDKSWLEGFRELGHEALALHPFGDENYPNRSALVRIDDMMPDYQNTPTTLDEAVKVINRR